MTGITTGGCQCGAVRYRIEGRLAPCYACHCRECQKQSASAFALSLPVGRSAFHIEGPLACWERPADSGATTRCHFCTLCGTRLYHVSSRSPDRLSLKAGTLDATDGIEPVAHIWVSRKQPWVRLPTGVPAFATQPDDFAAWRRALLEEWR